MIYKINENNELIVEQAFNLGEIVEVNSEDEFNEQSKELVNTYETLQVLKHILTSTAMKGEPITDILNDYVKYSILYKLGVVNYPVFKQGDNLIGIK